MIVTLKKSVMTVQSRDMTILMMEVWDGHPQLRDRKCLFYRTGGIGLKWPLVGTIFHTFVSFIQPTEGNLDQATEAHFQPVGLSRQNIHSPH